jgi:hypothetical protein
MKAYIDKIEKLVEEKLNEKPKRKVKQTKGFMSKKNQEGREEDSTFEEQMDIIDIVATQIAHIRKQRMELKENGTTV